MYPEISVIIPTYNTAQYIQQAIASVLAQTFTNFEIVVVDDASTDATQDVLQSMQDPRLRVFRQSVNRGAGAARNRALREARGKWVAVLDSDDWYAPERLATLHDLAEAHEADMVADDLYIIEDGASQPRSTLVQYSGVAVPEAMVVSPVAFVQSDVEGQRGLSLGFSKPLFRRQFLVENHIAYKPEIKVSQDFWLDMDCLARGAKFVFLPEPYYYYRSREGALTTSTNRVERLSQECDAIARFFDDEAAYLDQNPDLVSALQFKLQQTRRIRDYCAVMDTLKRRDFLKAFYKSLEHPRFFHQMFSEAPRVVRRRFSRFFLGQDIYEKFI